MTAKTFFETKHGLMKDHGRVSLEWLLKEYNNSTGSMLDLDGVLYHLESYYLKHKLYYRITKTHVHFYPHDKHNQRFKRNS